MKSKRTERPASSSGAAPSLLVTVHGIRTFGAWQERLGDLVKSQSKNIRVYHYKYGYFSALGLALPFVRWWVAARFRRELLHLATSRNWSRIHLVGHSFGCYLIARALLKTDRAERPQIGTVILSGSFLGVGFSWRELVGSSVDRLINDCGTRDWVLVLGRCVLIGGGMAGRVGFDAMTGDRLLNRYFAFGHSGYFQRLGRPDDSFMVRYWLPALLTDEPLERVDERTLPSPVGELLEVLLRNAGPIQALLYLAPAVLAGYWILSVQMRAERNALIARAQSLSAQAVEADTDDPTRALLLAVEATASRHHIDGEPSAEAVRALHQVLFQVDDAAVIPGAFSEAVFGPSGSTLLLKGTDRRYRILDLVVDRQRPEVASAFDLPESLTDVRFCGEDLLASDSSGRVSLRSASNGDVLTTLEPSLPEQFARMRASRACGVIAVAGSDGTIYLWARSQPDRVLGKVWIKEPISRLEIGEGGQLAVGLENGETRLWPAGVESPSKTLETHEDPVAGLDFDGRYRRLLSATMFGELVLWTNLEQLPKRIDLEGGEGLTLVAGLTKYGRWAASRSFESGWQVWALAEAPEGPATRLEAPHSRWSHRPPGTGFRALDLSRDGGWLAAATADEVLLWNAGLLHESMQGGERSRSAASDGSAPVRVLELDRDEVVTSLAFDRSGTWIAAGNTGGSLRLWRTARPLEKPRLFRGHGGSIRDISWDADGTLIATRTEHEVRIWRSGDPQPAHPQRTRIFSRSEPVMQLLLDTTQEWLVARPRNGSLRLLPAADPLSEPLALSGSSNGRPIAIAPHHAGLASGGIGHLSTWDLSEPTPSHMELPLGTDRDSVHTWSLRYSPDGRFLISTGDFSGTVDIWDLVTTPARHSMLTGHSDAVRVATASPDGRSLVSVAQNDEVFLWDLQNLGEGPSPVRLPGDAFEISDAAYSSDGRFLAMIGDVNSKKSLFVFARGDVTKEPVILSTDVDLVVFSIAPASSLVAAGGTDGVVRVWDLDNLEQEPTSLAGHGDTVYTLAWSGDGQRLATQALGDVLVWDLRKATPRRILSYTDGLRVISLAFGPSADWLAAGTEDGDLLLFTLSHEQLRLAACRAAARELSLKEWSLYFADTPYRSTCADAS